MWNSLLTPGHNRQFHSTYRSRTSNWNKQSFWSLNVWGNVIILSEYIETSKISLMVSSPSVVIWIKLTNEDIFKDQTNKEKIHLRTKLNSKRYTIWHIQRPKCLFTHEIGKQNVFIAFKVIFLLSQLQISVTAKLSLNVIFSYPFS